MNLIIAIIQPQKLEAVRQSLLAAGVQGITTSDVQGYGRQKGHTEVYRGHEYTVNFVRKVKIEVACDEKVVESVVEAIAKAAKSGDGKIGDGKIFVIELKDAVRIRTGERGPEAL
ncbi:MAG TPA: P-II family nitrogen regulator [Planctomycetota bacterium]|nr:P-II family nitrogen regulator [Planctomycetota bacterium]